MKAHEFTEHFVVRLSHTDAAGVMFYPKAFEIEEELFERWLELGGMSVRQMLDGTLAPTPIVHCEGDYRLPVRVGDRLTVRILGIEVGRSGYTLSWRFSLGEAEAVAVRVKRVAIDPKAGTSIEIPVTLRTWIEHTQQDLTSLR